MDLDARPVNAGSPWSRVSKAAPATSSRPSDASHSRTPGPLTAPGTSSTSLPGFLASFPAIFRVLGLDIPWVWVGPPTTTRSAPSRMCASAEVTGTSHEVIVQTIAATTTRTGLTVAAELDPGHYPKGIKIPDRQMKDLEQQALRRHQFHGEWNYDLIPAHGP